MKKACLSFLLAALFLLGVCASASPAAQVTKTVELPDVAGVQSSAARFSASKNTSEAKYLVYTVAEDCLIDEFGDVHVYSIPAINGVSKDIRRMNDEIYAMLKPYFNLDYDSVQYEWYSTGRTVSVLCRVIDMYSRSVAKCYVMNVNLLTGEELSRADLIKSAGFSEKSFLLAARAAVTDAFNMMWQYADEDDVPQYETEQALAQTLAESSSALLMLGEEGELCIVARIYTYYGMGYTYRVIPLSV